MATRVAKAKKTVSAEHMTVAFDFNGGGSFIAELVKLPQDIITRLALHGVAQKLGDTYAGDVENPEFEVRSLFSELEKGVWSQRAESGGPRVTLLAEALAEMRTIKRTGNGKATAEAEDIEYTVGWLDDKSDEEKKALRTNAHVAAKMSEIQIRKAQAKLRDQRTAAKDAPEVALPF